MKKIWKYIVGFFSVVGGILFFFLQGKNSGKRNEKIKQNKKATKKSYSRIKQKEIEISKINENLKKTKADTAKLKKKKYKKKDVGSKEASDFLKKYSKGKK
tara:strand:+ start:56 stop:358 length:303 start_codon:yes stop_codon:yes gene_type:complete